MSCRAFVYVSGCVALGLRQDLHAAPVHRWDVAVDIGLIKPSLASQMIRKPEDKPTSA